MGLFSTFSAETCSSGVTGGDRWAGAAGSRGEGAYKKLDITSNIDNLVI
jgi:hypothetical protein